MFIREVTTNNKKNGANYTNHKLVEAFRNENNEITAKAIESHKLLQKKTEVKTLREDSKQLVTADLNSFNTTEDRSLGAELVEFFV